MQEMMWKTGFLVSIVFAQFGYCQSSDKTPDLNMSEVLNADSTVKQISNPSHDITTDVLQEKLYIQIIAEINDPQSKFYHNPPTNRLQLLNIFRQYYPNVILINDTLVIPYPHPKVEKFREIKYIIPSDYFLNHKFHPLQPQIQLKFNSDQSTLLINNSYYFSLYQAPVIHKSTIEQLQYVVKHIYNLFIPYERLNEELKKYGNKAIVHYKGYKEHKIILNTGPQLNAFWESIFTQGSLYFFPSKIDDLESKVIIYGLIYVMKDDIITAYHFGELRITFLKQNLDNIYELVLDFYPLVVNKQIGN
jgi:hypothetical protein